MFQNKLFVKKDNHNNKAITVLGSGRCGTSMVTRAINFLGVNLGSSFVPPNPTNPKGFFENERIVAVHKKIKAKLGKRPFPDGWEKKESIQPYKHELKAIIKDEFGDQALWGWKDPRTSESIALWKDILHELGATGHYIIMIRNPVDVAASYQEAYNRKENSAIEQWQMRTLLALQETAKANRIVIDYDDFLEDSYTCLQKIANQFDITWPKDEKGLKDDLDNFIDPSLQHSRTTMEELAEHQGIHDLAKELYRISLKASRDPKILRSSRFNKQLRRLQQSYEKARHA